MLRLDQSILSVVALLLSRLRGAFGLKHWAMLSCIDAVFAGSLILFLLVSQNIWFLLAFPAFATFPSARKHEFLIQEETADFLNQPMKNPRQEWLPTCLLRYGSCVVYAGLLAYYLWLEKSDWITTPPLIAGITKAFAEAADVYPGGKAIRDHSKVFLPLKTVDELG